MRFSVEIPDPLTMRVGKESYKTLSSGTELHRIHPAIFGPTQFNNTDKGDARFSPIRTPSSAIIPTVYGGETFECAACEIILRCPDAPPVDPRTGLATFQIVFPSDYAHHTHSIVRTTADMRLVDLTVSGQRKIGVNQNALLAGPKSTYPATRAWAERIHTTCTNAQGIYYNSFQAGPLFAVVLFEDRLPVSSLIEVSTRQVAGKPCHDEIAAIADALSIEYENV
jgi:hypothetical protein